MARRVRIKIRTRADGDKCLSVLLTIRFFVWRKDFLGSRTQRFKAKGLNSAEISALGLRVSRAGWSVLLTIRFFVWRKDFLGSRTQRFKAKGLNSAEISALGLRVSRAGLSVVS